MTEEKVLRDSRHAVIIGSGFAGIAAALRLRALGLEVTLLERLDNIGGRAQVFERGGYRHDAGPTVITAPFLFEELFELFGEELSDHLEFVPLDPFYRFHFPDGSRFDYRASIDDTLTEIRRFSSEDADGYIKLLAQSKRIYDIGFKKLVHRPFTRVWDMIKQVPALLYLQCYKTVAQMVNSYLAHPLMRQAFSIHPLLVGGNPFNTTSIYSLIHYLERRWGIFFCMGGTGKLVEELRQLMLRHDIEIRNCADVTKIIIDKNRATSVLLSSGNQIDSDLVVFAGDPAVCYEQLLDKPSAKLRHHTIWMGPRFRDHLTDIFDRKHLADDFSLYLHRPTATDKSFAPENCESFYVLCPVPNLEGNVDWDKMGPELADKIVTALDQTILPELPQVIDEMFWMTPKDFKNEYRSLHGAGFSIAPRLTQSAYFRYHNRDASISNLYFVGAGTHPGAGLPGVVSSAKVVEELLTGFEVGSGG